MSRKDLKEIIARVIAQLEDPPKPACFFGDAPDCDVTTYYAVGEEG